MPQPLDSVQVPTGAPVTLVRPRPVAIVPPLPLKSACVVVPVAGVVVIDMRTVNATGPTEIVAATAVPAIIRGKGVPPPA